MSNPVSFHFNREVHHVTVDGKPKKVSNSAFAVVVNDDLLNHVRADHPLRYLLLRFNAAATPARRLRALADTLEELEREHLVRDENADQFGFFQRMIRRFLGRKLKRRNP